MSAARPQNVPSRTASIIALAAVMLIAMGAGTAQARPRVAWTLPPTADAGVPMSFSWTATGLKKGHRLVAQRRQGTAGVWRTVRALPRVATGQSTLPALKLGTYRMRIAVLGARRRVHAARERRVRVFGSVPLSILLGEDEYIYSGPTNTFAYVAYRAVTRNGSTLFTVTRNPCRSVHIDFVHEAGRVGDDELVAVASVVQESRDAVNGSAGRGGRGALDVALTPGESWSVKTWTDDPNYDWSKLYVNGWASCYSSI